MLTVRRRLSNVIPINLSSHQTIFWKQSHGGDQSASLFSSPGYGKIDLSNKAFWKQCMLVWDPLASIEHFV